MHAAVSPFSWWQTRDLGLPVGLETLTVTVGSAPSAVVQVSARARVCACMCLVSLLFW